MMRRTFVFCLFISATICLSDDIAERIAELLSMTATEVQTCLNKTNVNIEDTMRMDELVNDNIETVETDKSALKLGCLFACLFQRKGIMSGSYIDLDRIKELSTRKFHIESKNLIIRDHILNKCNDRVRSKTNECDIIIKFILCIITEVQQIYKNF